MKLLRPGDDNKLLRIGQHFSDSFSGSSFWVVNANKRASEVYKVDDDDDVSYAMGLDQSTDFVVWFLRNDLECTQ